MNSSSFAYAHKDCDRFAADVQRAVDDYRFWHERDTGRDVSGSREALRRFNELTQEMVDWLSSALGAEDTVEQQAARKLWAASGERLSHGRAEMERALQSLSSLAVVRERAAEFLSGDKLPKSAPRMAASTLWALLPQHGIRVTLYEKGTAARLLKEIAWAAGDRSITESAARKFLMETQPNRSAAKPKKSRVRT